MRQFDFNAPDFAATFRAFLDERRGSPADVDAAVAAILAEVQGRGLDAVLDFAERFDKVKLENARVRLQAEDFYHRKHERCAACTLDPICAGVFSRGDLYDPEELWPLFIDPETIRRRVLRDRYLGPRPPGPGPTALRLQRLRQQRESGAAPTVTKPAPRHLAVIG